MSTQVYNEQQQKNFLFAGIVLLTFHQQRLYSSSKYNKVCMNRPLTFSVDHFSPSPAELLSRTFTVLSLINFPSHCSFSPDYLLNLSIATFHNFFPQFSSIVPLNFRGEMKQPTPFSNMTM